MERTSQSWVIRTVRRVKSKGKGKGKEREQDPPRKLQKRNVQPPRRPEILPNRQTGINELGEHSYSIFSEASTLVERTPDHTDMIHGLAHHGSFDSLIDGTGSHLRNEELQSKTPRSEKHEQMIESLPSKVWKLIATFLNPADAAHLTFTNKTLHQKLGNEPLQILAQPENLHHRIRFLNQFDGQLPNHLLCFPCGKFHRRTSKDKEWLRVDFVNHPVYNCPRVYSSYLPRTRLTHGRELPYSFIQLAIRHTIYSPSHGIPPDTLSRRWKDPQSNWSHSTRYMVRDGHLLLRIRSQIFAAPKLTLTALRHLLYERDDYKPYFSVCAHWRDGELMNICKCALSHIPEPPQSYLRQLKQHPSLSKSLAHPSYIVRMCDECRPARRCPECPTEYLVEVNMVEDKKDPVMRFKHALVVTRWSDLGDGRSPSASPEYCAVNGYTCMDEYDSFSHVGRRAVAGVFESRMSGAIPGQRMISLNPKNKKLGEEGHGWY